MHAWCEEAGIGRDRCVVIPHGVDVDRFAPSADRRRRKADEAFRLVCVGRLDPVKGHRYLIEAMDQLRDHRVSLEILGSGPQQGELQNLVAALHLERHVVLRGHMENPEDYLRTADAFVLASVSHESFGMVLAEAMAAGLPLVTTDSGSFPELNRDGLTGIVVPARDSGALARAVGKLMDNPDMCERIGRANAARACNLYSRDRMISESLNLHSSMVPEDHPAPAGPQVR